MESLNLRVMLLHYSAESYSLLTLYPCFRIADARPLRTKTMKYNLKNKREMFHEENRKRLRVAIYMFFMSSAACVSAVGAILHWTGVETCGIVAFVGLAVVFGMALGTLVRPSDFYILTRPNTENAKPHDENEFTLSEVVTDQPRVPTKINLH